MKEKLEFVQTDENTNADLLVLAIKKNIEIAKKMRKKTKELKMPKVTPKLEEETLISQEETIIPEKKVDNSDYERYYKKVDAILSEICKNPDNVDEDYIKDKLNYILPTLDNSKYDEIVIYIMNKLFKELISTIELYNLVNDEKEKEEYYTLMDSYNFLIELIEENKDYVKNEEPIKFTKHNIYFLTNESGKSSVIEDIKDFDPVFYPQIKKFFTDLEHGDLRKAKSISRSSNNIRKGMIELKAGNHGLNQMRLIFDKVDEKSYVVYHIFQKKSMSINKTLLPSLLIKKSLYDAKKDSIVKAIQQKDPKFIAEQDILYSMLNEVLSGEEYINERTM